MMLMKSKQSHEFKGLIIEGQGNLVKTKEDYSKILKKEENLLEMFNFCQFEVLVQLTKGFLYKTKRPMKATNFVCFLFSMQFLTLNLAGHVDQSEEKEEKG